MTKTVLFLDIEGPCHPADAASALPSRCVAGEDLFRWVEAAASAAEGDAPRRPSASILLAPRVPGTCQACWRTCRRRLLRVWLTSPPVEIANRQSAIEEYVKRHDVQRFVAVDDTSMQFDEGLPWLVVTGPGGLSDPQTIRALQEALECPDARQQS